MNLLSIPGFDENKFSVMYVLRIQWNIIYNIMWTIKMKYWHRWTEIWFWKNPKFYSNGKIKNIFFWYPRTIYSLSYKYTFSWLWFSLFSSVKYGKRRNSSVSLWKKLSIVAIFLTVILTETVYKLLQTL